MLFAEIYIPVVAVVAVREAADHRSEMTSQLLLGEPVRLLDEFKGEWLQVASIHDGYSGWCQKIQLAPLTADLPETSGYFTGPIGYANVNGQPITVFTGTPVYKGVLTVCDYQISLTGLSVNSPEPGKYTRERLYKAAYSYLGAPYLWGGRTIAGIDCSGFTQMVYRQLGIHLLRDAYLQATEGESIGFLQEARCGDLAFFDETDGRISHVGMMLNDHEIIHASGKVRIDKIDHQGIFNRDLAKHTHQLRLIRRYLP